MEQGLVFWEKYFKAQQDVTWDEFATAFTRLMLDFGKIQLDEDQLLVIKSIVDPDYRNIVKVAHYLIFQDTFWRFQSKRQQLLKHQIKKPIFEIPPQLMSGLQLKILSIAQGYSQGDRDIEINRTDWIKSSYPVEGLEEIENVSPYVQSMYVVQTPIEQQKLKTEEVFIIGSSATSDFVVKDDIQMNPQHLKLVWTPYNLFLIKDIAKSFRTVLRLQAKQKYLIDYLSVYKLGPETSFYIKQIEPIPKFTDDMLDMDVRYIETSQEHTENYFPYLLKQLQIHGFRSVAEYRHAVDSKQMETPNMQVSKSFLKIPNSTIKLNDPNLDKSQVHTKIPTQSQVTQSIILSGPTLLIEFLSGPFKGQSLFLEANKDPEITMGKSKECRIPIPDHNLQNQHIRLFYEAEYGWLIEPLDQNIEDQITDPTVFGTFLFLANKTQLDLGLPSRAHVLQEGMAFVVGPYLFQAAYQSF